MTSNRHFPYPEPVLEQGRWRLSNTMAIIKVFNVIDGTTQIYDTESRKIPPYNHKTSKRKHPVRIHKKRIQVHNKKRKRLVRRKPMGNKKTTSKRKDNKAFTNHHPPQNHPIGHRQRAKRGIRPAHKRNCNRRWPIHNEVNHYKGTCSSPKGWRTWYNYWRTAWNAQYLK